MRAILRKTDINWLHFIYGLPFLAVGITIYVLFDSWIAGPFLGLGLSYSLLEILMGENPEVTEFCEDSDKVASK